MTRLRVVPIVEGHGEREAIRPLLERIWRELMGGEYIEVLQPVRLPRSQLHQDKNLQSAIGHAVNKLKKKSLTELPSLVLIVMDADDDLPCLRGPELQTRCQNQFPHVEIACVFAKKEYETWFVAAADSLKEYLEFENLPNDPERANLGKGWIEQHFIRAAKYSENRGPTGHDRSHGSDPLQKSIAIVR